MNNGGRLAEIGTNIGAALTRNPEVLARTQAANDAVKLKKFGRRIFKENDPTKISEKEILEAAAEFDVPPDQAVEFVGRFFQQRMARQARQQEPMGLVSVPLGDGRYVKREVPQSQIPGIMQENPQAVAGQVYGSRNPRPQGGGGWSPNQQMKSMELEAWNAYMGGSASPQQQELIGVGGGGGGRGLSPSQRINQMKVEAWERMRAGTATDVDRALVNQDKDPYFNRMMAALLQNSETWDLPPKEMVRR